MLCEGVKKHLGVLWSDEGFYASEGVRNARGYGLRGAMRALAKFQVNLAIPNNVSGYFSTRGKG